MTCQRNWEQAEKGTIWEEGNHLRGREADRATEELLELKCKRITRGIWSASCWSWVYWYKRFGNRKMLGAIPMKTVTALAVSSEALSFSSEERCSFFRRIVKFVGTCQTLCVKTKPNLFFLWLFCRYESHPSVNASIPRSINLTQS